MNSAPQESVKIQHFITKKKITQRVPNQLKESNLKCSGLSVNMAAAITLLDMDMTLMSFCNIIICQRLRFLPL